MSLSPDTQVLTEEGPRALRDMSQQRPFKIWDGFGFQRATLVCKEGVVLWRLALKDGAVVWASADHRFLTRRGATGAPAWTELRAITKADQVAVSAGTGATGYKFVEFFSATSGKPPGSAACELRVESLQRQYVSGTLVSRA